VCVCVRACCVHERACVRVCLREHKGSREVNNVGAPAISYGMPINHVIYA
jgi:hypothetical protein